MIRRHSLLLVLVAVTLVAVATTELPTPPRTPSPTKQAMLQATKGYSFRLMDHQGEPIFAKQVTLSLDSNGWLIDQGGNPLWSRVAVPTIATGFVIGDDGSVVATMPDRSKVLYGYVVVVKRTDDDDNPEVVEPRPGLISFVE